jgi:hypothetical protein
MNAEAMQKAKIRGRWLWLAPASIVVMIAIFWWRLFA